MPTTRLRSDSIGGVRVARPGAGILAGGDERVRDLRRQLVVRAGFLEHLVRRLAGALVDLVAELLQLDTVILDQLSR